MAGCFYTPSMDEAALLRHIYARAGGAEHDAVLVGPGDDCAVVDLGGDRACLLTTDQLIEGRHFEPGTPIEQIAWKAMARSVSDIAACAGEPVCALATGAMPDGYAHAAALFDAMHRAAIELGCPLVGGDVARAGADGGVHLTTTLIGRVHATRGAVLRSGARSGDAVVVTGCLGGSFDARVDGDGVAHHLGFTPRVEAARRAADMLGDDLHAMMDLSDGLGVDVARLAEAAGVMSEIDAAALPVAPELAGAMDAIDRAVGDGEDYELLATVDAARVDDLDPEVWTRIGTVGEAGAGDAPRVWMVRDGGREPIDGRGFMHRTGGGS